MTTLSAQSLADKLLSIADSADSQLCADYMSAGVNLFGDSAVLEQVADFLAPFYEFRPGHHPAAAVRVGILPFDTGNPRAPELDMRRYVAASAVEEDLGLGRTLHLRPAGDVIVLVDRARGMILVGGSHPEELARQARLLIRDQLFGELERQAGFVIFHSSAVAANGDGVVFMGQRDSGKTTSMLALLAAGQHGFAGADRVKLRPGVDGIEMIGVPGRCTLDPRVVATDPFVGQVADQLTERTHDGKIVIGHKKLSALAKVPPVPRATLRMIVAPEVTGRDESLRIEAAEDMAWSRQFLLANLMDGTKQDLMVPWLGWYSSATGPHRPAVAACADAVAARVPIVRVRGGYAQYRRALEEDGLAILRDALKPPASHHAAD